MQTSFDRLNAWPSTAVPSELIGCIVPTRTEEINLSGVFRLPAEAYAERPLPTSGQKKSAAGGT